MRRVPLIGCRLAIKFLGAMQQIWHLTPLYNIHVLPCWSLQDHSLSLWRGPTNLTDIPSYWFRATFFAPIQRAGNLSPSYEWCRVPVNWKLSKSCHSVSEDQSVVRIVNSRFVAFSASISVKTMHSNTKEMKNLLKPSSWLTVRCKPCEMQLIWHSSQGTWHLPNSIIMTTGVCTKSASHMPNVLGATHIHCPKAQIYSRV